MARWLKIADLMEGGVALRLLAKLLVCGSWRQSLDPNPRMHVPTVAVKHRQRRPFRANCRQGWGRGQSHMVSGKSIHNSPRKKPKEGKRKAGVPHIVT